MQNLLSIILPCYNEEEILISSVKSILLQYDELICNKLISENSEIILVDDGSTDGTWNIISNLVSQHTPIKGIKISRNVGQQNALLAGLSDCVSYCDIAITIDADLQDDISLVKEMILKYDDGAQIVYGIRNDRSEDAFFKKKTAQIFYGLMKNSRTTVIPNHADFRLMSRNAIEALLEFKERNLFLRGIVPLIGFKTDNIYYTRKSRIAGKSKYPLVKMISFAIEGITSFSVRPIRLIFATGFIFLLITLSVAIYVFIAILQGRNFPGWASLMLSLWFIGSLILMALGIIGEYVSKIYLEVKRRPRYFIEKIITNPNQKNRGA